MKQRMTLLLALLVLIASKMGAAAESRPDYSGYHASFYLRFLDPPAPGLVITEIPHLRMSVGGGAPRSAVMDTGSTGIVVSASAISDIAGRPSQGPASLAYSSSGHVMEGTWVITPVTISGADGESITTPPIPVIAVTRISCLPSARNCTPEDAPDHVAMIGVGFGREYDHQEQQTPDKNPFLVATSADMRRGYVITGEGVHIGLTSENAAGAFSFVKLTRESRWPDWSGAPACIVVGDTAPACGRVLVDTGVAGMYLTVPEDRLTGGGLPPGTTLRIRLGPGDDPQAAGYSFAAGDMANAMAPGFVTLSGFDYLFDADGGWVGFRPK
jgi:predicted aspartyl protease